MSPLDHFSSLRLRLSVVRPTASEEATSELIRRLARLVDPAAAAREACDALCDGVARRVVHCADVAAVLLAVAAEAARSSRGGARGDDAKARDVARAAALFAAPTDEHEN